MSGNPEGRKPDEELAAARRSRAELAGPHAEMAMESLASIAKNGESESARVTACQAILDSRYGKLAQLIGEDKNSPFSGLSLPELLVEMNKTLDEAKSK